MARETSNADFFTMNNRGMSFLTRFERKGRKKSTTIGGARERFQDCEKDIKGAIDAMAKAGYRNIILMGHSTGCQKITYYQYKTRDSRVKALVLLGPVDDYNLTRKQLKRNFNKAVKVANHMVKTGKGSEITPEWISRLTARRFLSYADSSRIESRLFNYDSSLKEFSTIVVPVLAVFGSKEEYVSTKSVKQCLGLLKERTSSERYDSLIIDGANHGFDGKERELSLAVVKWIGSVV